MTDHRSKDIPWIRQRFVKATLSDVNHRDQPLACVKQNYAQDLLIKELHIDANKSRAWPRSSASSNRCKAAAAPRRPGGGRSPASIAPPRPFRRPPPFIAASAAWSSAFGASPSPGPPAPIVAVVDQAAGLARFATAGAGEPVTLDELLKARRVVYIPAAGNPTMEKGTPCEFQEAAEFWLKAVESLRRLDLAVEIARRDAEERIPKCQAAEVTLFVAEWLRIAFAQFLSSEGPTLMGIKNLGEFKKYALERFRGIIDLTPKNSLQTRSAVPEWAAVKIREIWNGSTLSAKPNPVI